MKTIHITSQEELRDVAEAIVRDLGRRTVVAFRGEMGAGKTTLIREITAESYAALKAGGIVSKGMIPKVENALKAVANGVRSVTIKHSENLLNDTGTVIR